MNFELKLAQQAKSAGGDKYQIIGSEQKERFIYVPQKISRTGSATVKQQMNLALSKECPSGTGAFPIEFTLLKAGKTGDDRYKSADEKEWSGDIYLPQEIRSEKLYLTCF